MLSPQDKQAIDACITRPESVWTVIKEIAIKKYDAYLTALKPTCNTPGRQSELEGISGRWAAVKDDQAKKEEFLRSEAFDKDLCYVLKAVAQRIHGLSTKFLNLKPYLENWHTNYTIDRKTAFIISIGFGFNIDEARELLYTALDDDEQVDFNPRLPNEMIYAYAIINGIPVTAPPKKFKGEEVLQPSVENMLYEAKIQFLGQLFGNADAGHFPRLIELADKSFNILDSLNMTKTALLLAAIKTSSDTKILLESIAKERKAGVQNARRLKLFPDESVMQRCYEYVSYDHEDKYCNDRIAEPNFSNAQIQKDACIAVLKYVITILGTATNQVDSRSEGSDRRKAIYSTMKKYIEVCVESVRELSGNALLSVVDFLPLFGNSELGQFLQSEFSAMVDTIIVKKLEDEWQMHCEGNNRTTSYHGTVAKVSGKQVEYFRFFFHALKVAFRDLRAVTARGCQELWPVYVEMNRILAYPYFNHDGVGMKVWEYDADLVEEGDDYRFTVDILLECLNYAEKMPNPSRFLTGLLMDVHCFEFFNNAMVSRGKDAFVSGLDKDDESKLIGRVSVNQTGHVPLFLLQEDDTFTQDDDLQSFYHYRRFLEQYYAKATAFSRKDILKLAFWGFLGSRQNYNPKLGPDDFTDYFDNDVARDTCCAVINESNSLDRFLLLCLEHEDPIQFLKEVIAFYKTLPKKESRDFWKMLR